MNSTKVRSTLMKRKAQKPFRHDIQAARRKLPASDQAEAAANLRWRKGVKKSRYGLAFGLA